VNEYSSAANDEVNLVLCMRRLLARAQREAKGYVKSATLHNHDGALARGAWYTRLSLGKTDNTATTWLVHASLLVRRLKPARCSESNTRRKGDAARRHYVFDLWVQAWRQKRAHGDVIVVRFADNIVVGFKSKADADQFRAELTERMKKFNLELHPETR
jgi:hypothetical protein